MDLLFIITPQLSAGKHRSTTTLNHSEAHNLQQNSKGENYIKENHATPSIMCIIIEEL
jgi:hypothetical protein